jgi:hypothetical protein
MEQPKQTPDTPQEESIFNEADFNMQGYDKHIRNARIMLFIIAGLQLLSILLEGPLPDEVLYIVIAIQSFIAAVFVGLAFWTKKKPYVALLTALIFYLTVFIIFGILDPSNFYRGIIMKVVVVVLLIQGIRNGKEAEELKKTFGK